MITFGRIFLRTATNIIFDIVALKQKINKLTMLKLATKISSTIFLKLWQVRTQLQIVVTMVILKMKSKKDLPKINLE